MEAEYIYIIIYIYRGGGVGPADPAAAGPMFADLADF